MSRRTSWTITNAASDMSSACTVQARDEDEALESYAQECGFSDLDSLLRAKGLTREDLLIHKD